jgi:hypothetical protein
LALMASTPSSGSATHSRQPMVGVIMDRDAIRQGRRSLVMPGACVVPTAGRGE